MFWTTHLQSDTGTVPGTQTWTGHVVTIRFNTVIVLVPFKGHECRIVLFVPQRFQNLTGDSLWNSPCEDILEQSQSLPIGPPSSADLRIQNRLPVSARPRGASPARTRKMLRGFTSPWRMNSSCYLTGQLFVRPISAIKKSAISVCGRNKSLVLVKVSETWRSGHLPIKLPMAFSTWCRKKQQMCPRLKKFQFRILIHQNPSDLMWFVSLVWIKTLTKAHRKFAQRTAKQLFTEPCGLNLRIFVL